MPVKFLKGVAIFYFWVTITALIFGLVAMVAIRILK